MLVLVDTQNFHHHGIQNKNNHMIQHAFSIYHSDHYLIYQHNRL